MKLINNLIIILLVTVGLFSTSCEDIGLDSLEKPANPDVTIDTIFSSTEYAERVLWYGYKSLRSGIPHYGRSNGVGLSLQSDITDLSHSYVGFTGAYKMYYTGAINSANVAGDEWQAPLITHPYRDYPNRGVVTFKAMRNCHILIDNIHKVPDMTEEYKAQLSAEARTIIAYNMMELFRNYGGVPWIGKVYAPDDDFTNPRLTVEATVDSIVGLLDTAIPDLPWAISESEMSNWAGRFTQAGAMALKTRLLLFAASPLFNSDQPYLDGEAASKKYTWYGDYQESRWQRAADAAKTLIDKIETEGGYALEMPATEDVWGYRDAFKQAFFSRESSEVLISVRDGYTGPTRWVDGMYSINLNYGGGACTNEYMRMFPMADGTPITDPSSGWDESVDPLGCEGSGDNRQYSRDPRLYETMQCVDDTWAGEQIQNWKNPQEGKFGKHVKSGHRKNTASTVVRKFIPGFNSGIPVKGHHFPYMRIPEIYLSYAEAMNELNNQSEAYTYINKVRNRVGLKNIEDVSAWSKDALRDQILTERACEFGFEQVRWFDMTRHKLTAAFEEQLHNVWILKNADDTYSYTYPEITTTTRVWWSNFNNKWFLLPFPVDEVQKGYGIIQNPGW